MTRDVYALIDLIGASVPEPADEDHGVVYVNGATLTPDEARALGHYLTDMADVADGGGDQ